MLFLSYVQLIKNGCNLCILVFTQIFDNERRLPGTNFFVFPVHRFFPVHTMSNVLIIEDDPNIYEVIELILSGEGHSCRVAPSGTQGLQEIEKLEPDIITLDLMLGEDETGLEVCKKIRRKYAQKIGIIIITAKSGGYTNAIAISNGADYFIEKPFDPELLKIYVRNLADRIKDIRAEAIQGASSKQEHELRREEKTDDKKQGEEKTGQNVEEEIIVTKHLSIDLTRNKVFALNVSEREKKKEIDMTEQTMRVLAFLIKNKKDLSRKEIMKGGWKEPQYNERLVDKHVCLIRRKINEAYGREMELIVTVSGYGYRFVDEQCTKHLPTHMQSM